MSPPRLPPQESFESVFSLQGPVEPDHENHITSSFSVLDIITDPCSENLDIHAIHSKRPSRKNNAADVYKGNMSCFSLAGIGNDLGHIALSPTPQENHAIAGASITVLSDSRAATQLGNSSNSSTTASSIYSHSLLQPIRKLLWRWIQRDYTNIYKNRCTSYSLTQQHQQENTPVGRPSKRDCQT